MERRTVSDILNDDWDLGELSAEDAIKELRKHTNLGYDRVRITVEHFDGYGEIQIVGDRPENDGEFAGRMSSEARVLDYHKKQRYAEFQKLKQEFDSDHVHSDINRCLTGETGGHVLLEG